MKFNQSMDGTLKASINELVKISMELNHLKSRAVDEKTLRDYDIYLRDIRRFLKKASLATPSLEDVRVYVDDYRGVIQYAKAHNISA